MAPSIISGRPQSVTLAMFDILCKHLIKKPNLYHDEIVLFLLDKFNIYVLT